MICVTGNERDAAALAARLREGAAAGHGFHEIRADLLERVDDELMSLVGNAGCRVIVACRSRAEGGGFGGSEWERADLLARAIRAGAAYVDVDLAAPAELRQDLFAARGRARVIVSSHVTERSPSRWREAARELSRARADVLKLAVAVADAVEVRGLLDLLDGEERPVVRIAMGTAGLVTRVLPGRLGSPWTYAPLTREAATADGQLPVDELLFLGGGQGRRGAPIALVGGPQVMRSPGLGVYNRMFAAQGAAYRHVPVVTTRAAEAVPLLARLGFGGAAVTMPGKVQVLPALDRLDPEAARCGSVNTVTLRDGRAEGFTTDGTGVVGALGGAALVAGRRVLLLGAGGLARAAAGALGAAGAGVAVAARSPREAEASGAFAGAAIVPWEARRGAAFDVLVNCTPVGSDGRGDPFEGFDGWDGKVVLEAVTSPATTPLMERASREGAAVVPGIEMWFHQGARQMQLITGLDVTPSLLRSFARD